MTRLPVVGGSQTHPDQGAQQKLSVVTYGQATNSLNCTLPAAVAGRIATFAVPTAGKGSHFQPEQGAQQVGMLECNVMLHSQMSALQRVGMYWCAKHPFVKVCGMLLPVSAAAVCERGCVSTGGGAPEEL
jgi:hypothetical protein